MDDAVYNILQSDIKSLDPSRLETYNGLELFMIYLVTGLAKKLKLEY